MNTKKNKNSFSKTKWIVYGFLALFAIAAAIIIPASFAAEETLKSVVIKSQKANYDNKEAGSWAVTESAEWIDTGKARLTIDIDTALKNNSDKTDMLLVIDTSSSMNKNKLDGIKNATTELVSDMLSDSNNRVSLISFNSTATVLSNFTSDKNLLISQIQSLNSTGNSNYYRALMSVDTVLKNYNYDSSRRCIVLFVTDGYSDMETSNEQSEYTYLKSTYPFLTIKGIQYETGGLATNPTKKISDVQYSATIKNIRDVLLDASSIQLGYSKFNITDYIDNRYFDITDKSDINVSLGEVSLDDNKVVWTIGKDTLKSGNKAKMTINISLKDNLIGTGNLYTVISSSRINSKIEDIDEDVSSNLSPKITDSYFVTYDGNAPSNCQIEGVPATEKKTVLSTVEISQSTPSCKGYKFKGWKIVNNGISRISDNYFKMPEEDVTIRAIWSKASVSKSMDGTIQERQVLATQLINQKNEGNVYSPGNTLEVFEFSHEATSQTTQLTDYRFIGSSPNNYIYFNCSDSNNKDSCELWRIVGVFPVDDGTGKVEYRVKISRNTGIGFIPFNQGSNINDWTISTLKNKLNTGDYYQGLSSSSKSVISDAKWYLGGNNFENNLNAEAYYKFERGTNVYNSRSSYWIGKVAVIYPSDYAYTYAYGVNDRCYNNGNACDYGLSIGSWMYNMHFDSSNTKVDTTPNNNHEKKYTWTLSPRSDNPNTPFIVVSSGKVQFGGGGVASDGVVIPTVYLNADAAALEGDGTLLDPYMLEY